jgi:hypothetical protein
LHNKTKTRGRWPQLTIINVLAFASGRTFPADRPFLETGVACRTMGLQSSCVDTTYSPDNSQSYVSCDHFMIYDPPQTMDFTGAVMRQPGQAPM